MNGCVFGGVFMCVCLKFNKHILTDYSQGVSVLSP